MIFLKLLKSSTSKNQNNLLIKSFVQGKHPCFNGKRDNPLISFDGNMEKSYMRVNNQNMGIIFRKDKQSDETYLFLGDVKKVKFIRQMKLRILKKNTKTNYK